MTSSVSVLSASQSESQLNFSGQLYHLSTVRSSPRFSLGGKEQSRRAPNTPGPGAYSPPSSVGGVSPRHAFPHSPRDPLRPSTSPGPGRYEVQPGRASKIHEFSRSPRDGSPSPNGYIPGPGTYPVRQLWGVEGLKPVLGRKLDVNRRASVPGPGSYAVRVDREVRPTNLGFGRSPRDPQPRSASPGPGAYAIPAGALAGPRFTIGSGREITRAPPPGAAMARAG
mmetsp:Transcript_71689/g.201093  ORF Transcript_71689/g.201093 Transcript_71689/m.201093 type:complete len:225 (+) Transcript_71689:66-740(+)